MLNSQLLKNRNTHERDAFIQFFEIGHKYKITIDPADTSSYTSVTTWVHKHFPKFDADKIIEKIFKSKSWGPDNKYWGMTASQIKAQWNANGQSASSCGTNLHENIETFMNFPSYDAVFDEYCSYEHVSDEMKQKKYTHADLYQTYLERDTEYVLPETWKAVEWGYFMDFVKDYPDLVPYRTEWTIFDEDLKLAGSIDMVYENPEDNTLAIYDWKRCKEITKTTAWNNYATEPLIKHIPDTNFWHYSLQLNTYKTILERKYGKKVTKLCLVRLHPDATGYELLDVPILEEEMGVLFGTRKE